MHGSEEGMFRIDFNLPLIHYDEQIILLSLNSWARIVLDPLMYNNRNSYHLSAQMHDVRILYGNLTVLITHIEYIMRIVFSAKIIGQE